MEKVYETQSKSPVVDAPLQIHWKQVWSLTAVYAAITIGWIAYQNYQPRLLSRFGFTDLAFALAAAQAVILVVTPLMAGRLGDRYRLRHGHRLPVISAGISMAAMVFMAVAVTLLANPGEVLKWVLPVLIILWLISMSIFTSPAISTMELFTPANRLPHVMAILTIAGNLLYSLEPVIVEVIDGLGAPVTFIAGGVAVLVSGYALRRNSLQLFRKGDHGDGLPGVSEATGRSSYGLIFLLGVASGVSSMTLFHVLPGMLDAKGDDLLPGGEEVVVAWMLFLSALVSWPASHFVSRYSLRRVFASSLAALVLLVGALYLSAGFIIISLLLCLFIFSFTALSITALPLAISRASPERKVFSVGVFFSGVALIEGLCQLWLAAH